MNAGPAALSAGNEDNTHLQSGQFFRDCPHARAGQQNAVLVGVSPVRMRVACHNGALRLFNCGQTAGHLRNVSPDGFPRGIRESNPVSRSFGGADNIHLINISALVEVPDS